MLNDEYSLNPTLNYLTLCLQYTQMSSDLQSVLDEKQDLVTERDSYKCKVHRLNHELNTLLKGDGNKLVDIDALVMENRYFQERLHQVEEEKVMAQQALVKYKVSFFCVLELSYSLSYHFIDNFISCRNNIVDHD